MADDDRELSLRAHIRNLLLDYSLTHLTTNYVTFTQDIVADLLSESLALVPDTDPNSLALPLEPFEVLSQRYKLNEIPAYDEKWLSDVDALKHIRANLNFRAQQNVRTRTCWLDGQEEPNYDWSEHRSMSPVLTTRAIRETPFSRKNKNMKKAPNSYLSLTRQQPFERASEHETELEESCIELDETLDLKPKLDPEFRSFILTLFDSVPSLARSRSRPAHTPAEMSAFLRADSPLPLPHRPMSPPIFCKERRPGYQLARASDEQLKRRVSGVVGLEVLPDMLPEVKIEDDSEDLFKQHMAVVDGWQTYAIPTSPPTPSLASESSEVDELFLPSPTRSLPIQELMSARIDDIIVPRSEMPGNPGKKPKIMSEGQNLGQFLNPFLPAPRTEPRIVTTPKSLPSSPHRTITASLFGNATPTALDSVPASFFGREELSDDLEFDFDTEMGQLYQGFKGRDPTELILKEKLDEKETLLMDVPLMPPPNQRGPSTGCTPSNLKMLVASVKRGGGAADNSRDSHENLFKILKTVKGVQPLTLELSWRPFTFHSTIPTNEELVGTAPTFKDGILADICDKDCFVQVSCLLRSSMFDGQAVDVSLQRMEDPEEDYYCGADPEDNFERVLTREDLQRLARLSMQDQTDSQIRQDEDEDSENSDTEHDFREQERIQARTLSTDWFQEDLPDGSPRPKKRARLNSSPTDEDMVELTTDAPFLQDSNYDAGAEMIVQDHDFWYGPADFTEQGHGLCAQPTDQSAGLFDDAGQGDVLFHEADAQYQTQLRAAIPDEFNRSPVFTALSAGSTQEQPVAEQTSSTRYDSERLWDTHADGKVKHGGSSETVPTSSPAQSSAFIPNIPVFSARQSLGKFLGLRSRNLNVMDSEPVQDASPIEPSAIPDQPPSPPRSVPEELVDRNTFLKPASWALPSVLHRYMASMEVIQKRALVRCLSSRDCAIDLLERNTLHGADLVLDPETAVIFVSLPGLSARLEAVTTRLGYLSWRYCRILLIFEAYPGSFSVNSDEQSASMPRVQVYSPPALKAVKRLRRDLGIAEACHTKRTGVNVQFAFAESVKDAAVFARMFGDLAEFEDATEGILWGEREWLTLDEYEGENDLALVDGMNAMAASVILSQVTLEEFLEMPSESREGYFAHLVGTQRIAQFNEAIALRFELIENSASSPLSMNGNPPDVSDFEGF